MNPRVMRVVWHLIWMLAACCLTTSCDTMQSRSSPRLIDRPIISETPTYPNDLRGARLFRIAPDTSMVHILVYRGGTMANLGHNHVISSVAVNGYVWYHEQSSLCGFDIALPVNSLIIDDNAARAAEGAEFPVNVPDTAKEGTRRNMLSEALLDSEHYPVIRLQSANIIHESDSVRIVVHITIKDQFHIYTFPVTTWFESGALHVRGETTIKHTDFGIKPYSVALGALQVQDELTIKFHLIADPLQ